MFWQRHLATRRHTIRPRGEGEGEGEWIGREVGEWRGGGGGGGEDRGWLEMIEVGCQRKGLAPGRGRLLIVLITDHRVAPAAVWDPVI